MSSGKIKPVGLGDMALADLFQFVTDLIALIEKKGADKLKITAQLILLKAAFKKFDDAYKKERKNDRTGKISALDKLRDGIISAILGIIRGMLYSMDAEVRAAAEKLKYLFDQYKGITAKSFKAESGETTNILQALTGKYVAEVTLLNLDKLVKELGDVNAKVISETSIRVGEWTESDKLNVKQSKKELITACRTIFKLIDVYVTTEGAANYADFIDELNKMITGYVGGTKTTPPAEQPSDEEELPEDDEPTTPPSEPVNYPDAKEWLEDLPFQGVENGDIYYILVAGKKVFYKLVDKQKFFWHPESERAAGGWEKLN